MRLIDADALKKKKVRSTERCEWVVPVAEIDWMPTIEPEPKTGKWMQTETMNIFECSCCYSRWNVYYVCDFDYCPCCGTKMVGGV